MLEFFLRAFRLRGCWFKRRFGGVIPIYFQGAFALENFLETFSVDFR
jgi:hypothetical protein